MQATAIEFISQIPLFADLNPRQLQLIADAYEERNYHPEDIIFYQGDPIDGMLTILSGQAVHWQHSNGSQRKVGTLPAGQTIYPEALFRVISQPTTLIAATQVKTIQLSRHKFQKLVSTNPDLKTTLFPSQSPPIHIGGEHEDEKTLLIIRQHWWAFAYTIWLPFVVMIVMWIATVLITQRLASFIMLISSLLLPGLILLYRYFDWRNNKVIITNQRVRLLSRNFLTFSKKISEISIESINEVGSEVPSFDIFAHLFSYGDIDIKTAGSAGDIALRFIPNPNHVQQIIIENIRLYEEKQQERQRESTRAELKSWFENGMPETDKSRSIASSKPINNTDGYFSTRTEMSNGDVVYRKHIYFLFLKALMPMTMMIGAGILVILGLFTPDSLGIVLFTSGFLLFLAGASSYYYTAWDWRNDYYVVSDETIVFIHQRPFFLQSLRDQILIERVDNVEAESSGLIASLLNFGDVRVSLIGADDHKMFEKVHNPQKIQQDISTRQQRIKQQLLQEESRQQREILAEYLNVYNEHINNPNSNYDEAQPTVPNPPMPNYTQVAQSNNTTRPNVPRDRSQPPPPRPTMSQGMPYKPPPPKSRPPMPPSPKKNSDT